MKHSATILLLLLSLCFSIQAQNKVTLSGVVTSADGEALPQVTIAVDNTSWGVVTDNQGKYTLQLPVGKHTLAVSFVGYETLKKTLVLHRSTKVDFQLKENAILLNAIQVYGKSRAQQIKESALTVNALNVQPLTNSLRSLTDLIDRSAGIRIRQDGGVGSDFELSINGLSGNAIRYFIDGIPMETKGSGISLANLPVNLIDRVEVYKGVLPPSLGTDALGGAINIITKKEHRNFVDASYSIGSFSTHIADFHAQYVEPNTRLVIRPTFGLNLSKNNYKMKEVEVWDESSRKYILAERERFHDAYRSLLGQVEVGIVNRKWADELFASVSYSQVNKELQTGSVQSKVYGEAERNSSAWNVSLRYQHKHLLADRMQVSALLSQTWDHSLTVDTAYRKYDWDGNYIITSRNEITGRARQLRHYKRPQFLLRTNVNYSMSENHSLNFNYLMSRVGNQRYDDMDTDFEPTNDALMHHILGLSYHQQLFENRMDNQFFVKDYVNHLTIRQSDLAWQTGANEVKGSNTSHHVGYGLGIRYRVAELFATKASFERSIRLPSARELLGNGTTVYPNVALKPEQSDNVNLGFFGTWHPAPAHTFSYEVNGFLRFMDNYIQPTISEKEGMMQYINVPSVHTKGLEGELHYDWDQRFHFTANLSWNDARDQRRYKTDGKPSATYQNRVPNRPWIFGNYDLSYTFRHVGAKQNRLRIGLNYQWVHWYFLTWEAYGARETKARIPTQHLYNAECTYSWHKERYNLSLTCNNLFDRLTYDNYKLQKPGRSLMLKFRLFIQ